MCTYFMDGPDPSTNTYTKKVSLQELEFNRMAEKQDICPRIVSVEKYEGKSWYYRKVDGIIHVDNEHKVLDPTQYYIMTSELYPGTLYEYLENTKDTKIFKKVSEKVKKLHELGILHGDLHQNNIVMNPSTKDVRIIDLGNSCYISELTVEDAQNDTLFWKRTFSTVKELVEHEENEIFTYAEW